MASLLGFDVVLAARRLLCPSFFTGVEGGFGSLGSLFLALVFLTLTPKDEDAAFVVLAFVLPGTRSRALFFP